MAGLADMQTTNSTTITTLSLALLLTPSFACTDDGAAFDHTADDAGETTDEPAGDADQALDQALERIVLTVNGETKPGTIDRASYVRLAVDLDPALVDLVEFYVDGELLAPDVEAPFLAMWIASDDRVNGVHEFTAVAVRDGEALAADSIVLAAALPEPGTSVLTIVGGDWSQIAKTATGLAMLGEDLLVERGDQGYERWRRPLPFTATAMNYEEVSDQLLIAGVVDGVLELASVWQDGTISWRVSSSGPDYEGVVIEGLHSKGSALALTGRRAHDGALLGWAAQLELEHEGARSSWTREFGQGYEHTSMGAPAFGPDAELYLPMTMVSEGPEQSSLHRAELGKYVGGEPVWTLVEDGPGVREYSAATVDAAGMIHLASNHEAGGQLTIIDSEGAQQRVYSGMGEALSAVTSTARGLIWAGMEGGDVVVGGLGGPRGSSWARSISAYGEQGARDLELDELGYIYVLSHSPTSSVIHKLHP